MNQLVPILLLFYTFTTHAAVIEGVYNGVSERDGQLCIVSIQVKTPTRHTDDIQIITTVAFTNELFRDTKKPIRSFSAKTVLDDFKEMIESNNVELKGKVREYEEILGFELAVNKLPINAFVSVSKSNWTGKIDEDSDSCINLEKQESFTERLRIYDI